MVYFDWSTKSNSIHNSLQGDVSIRRYTAEVQYTSNMADITSEDTVTLGK